jgi:hypothetical protein
MPPDPLRRIPPFFRPNPSPPVAICKSFAALSCRILSRPLDAPQGSDCAPSSPHRRHGPSLRARGTVGLSRGRLTLEPVPRLAPGPILAFFAPAQGNGGHSPDATIGQSATKAAPTERAGSPPPVACWVCILHDADGAIPAFATKRQATPRPRLTGHFVQRLHRTPPITPNLVNRPQGYPRCSQKAHENENRGPGCVRVDRKRCCECASPAPHQLHSAASNEHHPTHANKHCATDSDECRSTTSNASAGKARSQMSCASCHLALSDLQRALSVSTRCSLHLCLLRP